MAAILLTAAAIQPSASAQEDRPGRLLVDPETGRIVALGAETARLPAGEVHDFPDAVLFPTLIDCHAHLVQAGDGAPGEVLLDMTEEELVRRSLDNAARALQAGVSVIEDQGGRGRATIVARDRARLAPQRYPELLVAGRPVTTPRGHMWFLGGETEGAEGVRRLAQEILDEGADLIKLVGTGGGTPGTNSFLPQFTEAALRAGVDVARAAGRRATAHCGCTESIAFAARAGVDLIHHANFFDADGVRRFDARVAEDVARRGIFVDPTLWVTYSLFEAFAAEAAAGSAKAQAEIDRAKRHWEGKIVDVRRLYESGVEMVAGSDAGYRMSKFGDTWREVMTMHEVAMPVREALSAATDRAAKAIGVEKDAGALRPGLRADVLVLPGNPVEDLRHLGSPLAVYRRGQRIARGALAGNEAAVTTT